MANRTKHILTVKLDEDFDPEDPYYDFDVQCLDTHELGTECNTWFECETCRRSVGKLIQMGQSDEMDDLVDMAASGELVHGERHTLLEATIATEKGTCILYNNDSWESSAHDLAEMNGPGQYYIDFECDEYSVSIYYVSKKGEVNG